MAEQLPLDAKDYAILKELDQNFRQPFSAIGKTVQLSKNTVGLRYGRLKAYFLHNTTGINYQTLGYVMIKVYYSFDYFDAKIEQELIKTFQKYPSMVYAARFYGKYDLVIALLVNSFTDFIVAVNAFNENFAKRIEHKEVQIIDQECHLRHNFLYNNPLHKKYTVKRTEKTLVLTKTE